MAQVTQVNRIFNQLIGETYHRTSALLALHGERPLTTLEEGMVQQMPEGKSKEQYSFSAMETGYLQEMVLKRIAFQARIDQRKQEIKEYFRALRQYKVNKLITKRNHLLAVQANRYYELILEKNKQYDGIFSGLEDLVKQQMTIFVGVSGLNRKHIHMLANALTLDDAQKLLKRRRKMTVGSTVYSCKSKEVKSVINVLQLKMAPKPAGNKKSQLEEMFTAKALSRPSVEYVEQVYRQSITKTNEQSPTFQPDQRSAKQILSRQAMHHQLTLYSVLLESFGNHRQALLAMEILKPQTTPVLSAHLKSVTSKERVEALDKLIKGTNKIRKEAHKSHNQMNNVLKDLAKVSHKAQELLQQAEYQQAVEHYENTPTNASNPVPMLGK